jgi:hypothetical protein
MDYAWIVAQKERCCHLQFIIGFAPVLCVDQGDLLHS